MLAFIASPLGKLAAGAVGVAAVVAGFLLWLASHDAGLRETWAAEQRLAVAEAVEMQRVRGDAAAAAAVEAARAAALADAPIREVIRRVPVQTACAASPAVRAALDGLRQAAPGAGSAPPAR